MRSPPISCQENHEPRLAESFNLGVEAGVTDHVNNQAKGERAWRRNASIGGRGRAANSDSRHNTGCTSAARTLQRTPNGLGGHRQGVDARAARR